MQFTFYVIVTAQDKESKNPWIAHGYWILGHSLLSRRNLPTLGAIPREHHASINEDSSRSLPSGRGFAGFLFVVVVVVVLVLAWCVVVCFYLCRVCRVSSVFCVSKSVMYSHGHYVRTTFGMGYGAGAALLAATFLFYWMVGVCVAVVYSSSSSSIVWYYPVFARVAVPAVESLPSNHQSPSALG